jgi:hypothetical protein
MSPRSRATFAARCGDSEPPFLYESNNRLARRGGRGGRFRRLSLDRGLPGRLRQPQSRGHRAEGGLLAAATPALTQRLHALAGAGAWPGRAKVDIGGTIELSRGENCPSLLAHVIPLAAKRAEAVFDIDRPAAAVFVVDPAAGLGSQIGCFAARFGLTIAETRVLGKSLAATGFSPPPRGSTSPRRRRAPTRSTFYRKPEPTVRRSSSAGFFETSLPGSPASA